MEPRLVIETRDARGVTTLTLHRPGLHNAFDDTLIAQLQERLEHAAHDEACRIIVLAAEGKSFSAGADLAWMKRMAGAGHEANLDDARRLARLMHTLDQLRVPTVARVQGAAFGGGVGLIACCDVAIAAAPAVFALSEVRLGLIPSVISPYVVRAGGPRVARRLFLTAERFGAQEALRIGLVHAVVKTDQLDVAVERVLCELLEGGPSAQAEAKKLVREIAGRPIDDALLDDTAERIARLRASQEGREGLGAFLERRKPAWAAGRDA